MRIITGKHRGKKIETLNNYSIRPATDRVKSAIFNSLQSRINWNGAKVLDLFAGSGNIGLEALSRGARKITFVEKSEDAISILEKNILHLNEMDNCDVIHSSFEEYIKRNNESFDIVFADPPYAINFLNQLPNMIFFSKIVGDNGLLVIEHPTKFIFDLKNEIICLRNANYGRTSVSFFQMKGE